MTEPTPPLPEGQCTIKVHKPSTREMLFFLASGVIVGVPIALIFELYASNLCIGPPLVAGLCLSVLFAPFIEEFAKAFPLFYRHGETQRSLVTLGFLLGLGFGIAELFIYVFGVGAPFYVRLPLVFFHACSTAIVAYGIATKHVWHFYLIAVGLHMAINLLAYGGFVGAIGQLAALLLTYLLAWRVYKRSSERIVE